MKAVSLLLCGVLASLASAQGATSNWKLFSPASSAGPAAMQLQSTSWKLDASFGSGVVAERATSTNFVLEGSWLAASNAKTLGTPWLTSVLPLQGLLGVQTSHQVHGTALHLGASTSCSVGGIAATVNTRRNDQLTITTAKPKVPGWQSVVVTNGGGTSTLNKGIAVLPMMDIEYPIDNAGSRPSEIVYQGRQGDVVVWMLAAGKTPVPLPIPGYGYGFSLNFFTMIVLTTTPIGDPSGRAVLPLPAVAFKRPLNMQGFVFAPLAPYKPGAFTNVVDL